MGDQVWGALCGVVSLAGASLFGPCIIYATACRAAHNEKRLLTHPRACTVRARALPGRVYPYVRSRLALLRTLKPTGIPL